MTISRRALLTAVASVAASGAYQSVSAYPDRPVRWVTPYAAGGGADITSRAVAMHLGARLKQNILIDNKAGANGLIGADYVAKAAPDGYTYLSVTSGHLLHPFVRKKMPYDTMKDLVGVTALARSPLMFVANPSMPVNSLQELAALIRSNPGKYSFGSAENYGLLVNTMWNRQERLKAVHIPYKGSGQLLPGLVSGAVQYGVTSIPAGKGLVQSGRLKALAVTGSGRAKDLPDVPTVSESGLPEFVIYNHYSLYAPANTPLALLEQMQSEINVVVSQPELAAFFSQQSLEPAALPVSNFQDLVLREFKLLERLAEESNLTLD